MHEIPWTPIIDTRERHKDDGAEENSPAKVGRSAETSSPSYVSFKQEACHPVPKESTPPTLFDRRMLKCR